MKKQELKGSLALLLCAAIWGSTFVAQSVGMDSVGPFTFQAVRTLVGALVLLPVVWVCDKFDGGAKKERSRTPEGRKKLLIAGLICGTVMCIASAFQQYALLFAEPGKAGFLTALYILIVPILGLFLKKRPPLRLWGCVVLALLGLYLLCMKGSFAFSKGDVLLLISAFWYSVHIWSVELLAHDLDGVRLSCVQFFVCGVLSSVLMFTMETPKVGNICAAWLPILYAGILSCGVAYTLQIIGQQKTRPAVASLLMSFESVFAVLAGMVVLHQIPTVREAVGSLLMFAAIVICQLPQRVKNTVK